MPAKFTELVIDCADTDRVATFWSRVLDYAVVDRGADGEIEIGPADRSFPTLVFVRVPERKTLKNRIHIDVSPAGVDQATELQRLLALGARAVDVGQGEVGWIVLADPEGNEFCLLKKDVG